jgi:putative ABC transport system permease protein
MESNESLRDRIFSLIDQAFLMFDLLAVIAVVVASLGVVNTLTMNVIERTREIGMLRATGMTRGQVIRMVLAEAGLMGLVGGLFGLGYGILLSRIFLFGMTAMSGYKLDFIVPTRGVVIGILVALVVSQIAAFFPAMRASRTKILEAIQYE